MMQTASTYKDRVEAAACIPNDAEATGRGDKVKSASDVGCLGVGADWRSRFGVHYAIVDVWGGEVASKLQESRFIGRAVVALVTHHHNLHSTQA